MTHANVDWRTQKKDGRLTVFIAIFVCIVSTIFFWRTGKLVYLTPPPPARFALRFLLSSDCSLFHSHHYHPPPPFSSLFSNTPTKTVRKTQIRWQFLLKVANKEVEKDCWDAPNHTKKITSFFYEEFFFKNSNFPIFYTERIFGRLKICIMRKNSNFDFIKKILCGENNWLKILSTLNLVSKKYGKLFGKPRGSEKEKASRLKQRRHVLE